MKNGLFNIIRGTAFCFVLSIICLFGRVDIFAMNVDGSFISSLVSSHFNISIPQEQIDKLDKFANYYSVYDKFIFMGGGNHCSCFAYLPNSNDVILSGTDLELYCNSNGYEYLSDIFFRDSSYSCYVRVNGSNKKLTGNIFWYHNQLSDGSFSDYCPDIYYNQYNAYGKVLYSSSFESNSKYDSTLGYLKNCVAKRGTSSLKDCKSFSELFTHNIDYFTWDSLTTTSKEVKKVEYKLYFYNGTSVVHKENSFIESPQAGTYATTKYIYWTTFTDINWRDVLINKNAHYEIWFRPCQDNLYGDWCYFDMSLPSWLNRFINLYNENDGDPLSIFFDGFYNLLDFKDDALFDIGQCTYAEKEGTYEPSENLDTNHSFSKVVNSYVVNYIDNSDNSVDDVTNIIESLPPSTNSYTEIYNNITVIQNGNEDGSSLLDKFGDLLSFCKNFLTFIYNFINLILSPLSFLPGWLKSLLSMSIIAFIVICVIKTLRG